MPKLGLQIQSKAKRPGLSILTRKHGVREENPLLRLDDKYYPQSHIRTPELREEADKLMPAKSAKQYGMMQAIAHGTSTMKHGAGPSPEVAKEFISKTPAKKRKQFARALKK